MCADRHFSEPGANSGKESDPVRFVARRTRHVGGLADLCLVPDADVGREFTANFIAQPQSRLDCRKARSDPQFGHRLARQLHFDTRLEDQPLRDPLVVFRFDPGGQIALIREERSYNFV